VKPVCVNDYRELARRRLPRFLFEYIDGGSYAETTLARNIWDLQQIALRQRVLRNVQQIDISPTLFGQKLAMPVLLAPVGIAGLNARRGEVQAAAAAMHTGVPFCLSTVSACSIEEVRAGTSGNFWFQLYMMRDRAFMRDLLENAKAARCSALVFTVDMPVPATRYRDYRSGLAGAPGFWGAARRTLQALAHPRWAYDVGLRGRPHSLGNVAPLLGRGSGIEDFFAWMRNNFDASVTWKDLEWVRERWTGPLIVKGILDVADARSACEIGADGIVVSNHGGRQLDGVRSTARALPGIAEAVGHRTVVLVDGGIRSGLDVLRMLALGAKATLIGRPWVYGLAAGGRAGVEHVLAIIAAELRAAMALAGIDSIHSIGPDALDCSTSPLAHVVHAESRFGTQAGIATARSLARE
jgi:L-lactate dehydrogenase (cytochrome)